ncbi:MAG TPA: hypothetical protein VMK83_03575 [Gaiellaceae bacterium]|nr:hypothetical protein [Gaiellaceae bacterium]
MDGAGWNLSLWVRVALVAFVLAWILGPSELRHAVPIVVVFLVALGLEVAFVVGALRGGPSRAPDRSPQQVDRDRYGFQADHEDEEAEVDEWYEPAVSASPVRGFAAGLGVIAALIAAVLLLGGSSGWSSLSGERRAEAVERFSDEASEIAGKPVSIRCDEARDYVGAVQHADGVAVLGGELAILTPEICHDLYRLAFEGEVTGARTGRAIAVLAHEAWHLRGESDEGTTECYALQSGVELGVRLGLDEGEARRLMRQQLTENQLRGLETLEYRVGPECRDGGRLDLDPASGEFP